MRKPLSKAVRFSQNSASSSVCTKKLTAPNFVHTINRVEITYHPAKSASNIELRGLSFAQVADFDFQTAIIWIDARKAYPEVRISALGLLAGRVHALVFAETTNGIRVISFRKANKREVKRYEQETQPRTD